MFLKIKRDNLINFFVAIFLTSSIFLLSFDNVLWTKFWSTLKIPPNELVLFFLIYLKNNLNLLLNKLTKLI